MQDCFELGVILLRKKLYTQATKNLEKAARMWEGEPEELAQVGVWRSLCCAEHASSRSCSERLMQGEGCVARTQAPCCVLSASCRAYGGVARQFQSPLWLRHLSCSASGGKHVVHPKDMKGV